MSVPLAYFVINTDALDGAKARELRFLLLNQIPEAFGSLIIDGLLARLWQLAASRGDDSGSLGRRDQAQLARALQWPEDPAILIRALLDSRLIDDITTDECLEFAVHDWGEHQPWIRERKRKRIPGTSRNLPDVPVRKKERKKEREEATPLFSKEIPKTITPLVSFPGAKPGTQWDLTPTICQEIAAEYPGIDIVAQAKRALGWVNRADANRKTVRGYRRFLTKWIERDIDAGRAIALVGAQPSKPAQAGTGRDLSAPWVARAQDEFKAAQARGERPNLDDIRARHRLEYLDSQRQQAKKAKVG